MENESCSLTSRELGCCASLWILQSMALYYNYLERALPLCIVMCASCAFSEIALPGWTVDLLSFGRRTKTLEYGSCPTQLRYHLDTLTIVAATADRAIKGVRCIRQFPLGGTGGNSRISTFQFLASHRLSLITIYYELTRRPKTQAYVMTISAHAAVYRVGFGPWVRLHPALLSTTKMTRL